MKPASGALIALLNSTTNFRMADLLTVELFDGTLLRMTDADLDLVVDGNTFACASDQDQDTPAFKRSKTRTVAGLEVDTLDLTLFCGSTLKLSGVGLVRAAMNGALDDARVLLQRVFMPDWGDTSVGTLPLFEGGVAGVDPSSTEIRITVKSELERLNVAMPRNVYMPACSHVLFGPGCGVLKAGYGVTVPVEFCTPTTISAGDLTQPDNYFRSGVVVLLDGPAAGSRRAIKDHSAGVLTLSVPLPVSPEDGNLMTLYPGCDHSLGDQGCAKFNKKNRFRGFPWVPRPETAR